MAALSGIVTDVAILLPAISVAVALLILPGLLFYFDITPKIVVLLAGTAAAAAWGSGAVSALRASRAGRLLVVLAALQAVSLIVSTAFSTHPALSVSGSNWRRFGLLTQAAVLLYTLLLAGFLSGDKNRLRDLLRWISVAGLAASLYAILQYFGWDPWLPARAYHIGEGEWTIVRPPSTLGYASYAATFFLHAVFFGCALLCIESRQLWRWLALAAVGTGSAAVFLSGTRGAIAGWLAGALLLAWRYRRALSRRHAFVALAVVVAAAGFYMSPAGQRLRSRTRWYVEDPRGGARLPLWQDALNMGAQRWIAGWGLETFPAEFPRFQSPELARAYPDYYHESPHNVLLEAWTAQGLPGLAILLALCWLAFHRARASPEAWMIASALAAALLAQQFTSFTMPTALYFYLTVAMLVSLEPPDRECRPVPWLRWTAPVAAAVFVVYAVQLLAADRLLLTARRALDSGRIPQAVRIYEQARWWQPWGVSSDVWYSRSMVEAARRSPDILTGASALDHAVRAAERAAHNAEDRHNAWYNLAALYATRDDAAAVESALRRAIEVAPNWFKPHWTLAQLLAHQGRREEAAEEAALAADLNGGKNPEVAHTLQQLREKK